MSNATETPATEPRCADCTHGTLVHNAIGGACTTCDCGHFRAESRCLAPSGPATTSSARASSASRRAVPLWRRRRDPDTSLNPHQNVPAGTVHDQITDRPKTIFRDYDHAVIPEMQIDETGVDVLIAALHEIKRGITAYRQDVAAEAADDLDDEGQTP